MIVAIDGPAGAGKSTVARAVAHRLGFAYLDTGAMYRAVAWCALRDGVDTNDAAQVTSLTARLPVEFLPGEGATRVRADGRDVSDDIRSAFVGARASEVAAHAGVRTALVSVQQAIMTRGDWVADGRDIGTVVAPHAEVKVFLVADAEERARRRQAELGAMGAQLPHDDVLEQINARDARDSTREAGPLRPAADSTTIDTTRRTVEDVVEEIVALATARGSR